MIQIKGLAKQVLLVILDGHGLRENTLKNAVFNAKKPNLDSLFKDYPFTTIEAGGLKVGLPQGVTGNSEVGHMNLGAGRPVRQDLVRINESIANKAYDSLPKIQELQEYALKNTKRIHLMGLLSDGGVHSHIDHLIETISVLRKNSSIEIFFHAYMDGRDTPRDSGIKYLEQLLAIPGFKLASLQGRSIGMDRDRRWEKIELAYKTIIGNGTITNQDPIEYVKSQYDVGIFDEFIPPVLFDKNSALQSNDALFFMNFRPDRAIQISLALTWDKFNEFKTPIRPGYFLCMTPYVQDEVDLPILFDKERIQGGLCEILSQRGKAQFKIAETEKYAHITYFFNGGQKTPYSNEDQVLINSPKHVKTYDLLPEMSAHEVTTQLLKALDEKKYSFFLVNYANCDMVGHTGNYEAAVKAVETVDECVGKLMKKCEENDIALVLTADHGNSDQMIYKDGTPHTSHTNSPVPFAIFHTKLKGLQDKLKPKVNDGALMDVAPTILNLLGEDMAVQFTGKSIF